MFKRSRANVSVHSAASGVRPAERADARVVNVFVLSIALLLGAGSWMVRAAGVRPDPGAVANVDMQRVFAESEARSEGATRVTAFVRKMSQRFDEVSSLQYVTAQEMDEYLQALDADKPTDAQTKRIEDIKAASAKRFNDFQRLSAANGAALNAQDKAQLRELSAMQQQRPQLEEGLRKIIQQAVDEDEGKEMRTAQAEVRAIVSKMAKEQGFTEVYDTSALVYAPVDLTEQALHKAQAKKK